MGRPLRGTPAHTLGCRAGLCLRGGGVQEVPGAVTMAVAGDYRLGANRLGAGTGGWRAVAGGWGASKGMRQGVVGPLGNPPSP